MLIQTICSFASRSSEILLSCFLLLARFEVRRSDLSCSLCRIFAADHCSAATFRTCNATTLAGSDLAEDRIVLQVQCLEQVMVRNVPNVIGQEPAKNVASIYECR